MTFCGKLLGQQLIIIESSIVYFVAYSILVCLSNWQSKT